MLVLQKTVQGFDFLFFLPILVFLPLWLQTPCHQSCLLSKCGKPPPAYRFTLLKSHGPTRKFSQVRLKGTPGCSPNLTESIPDPPKTCTFGQQLLKVQLNTRQPPLLTQRPRLDGSKSAFLPSPSRNRFVFISATGSSSVGDDLEVLLTGMSILTAYSKDISQALHLPLHQREGC